MKNTDNQRKPPAHRLLNTKKLNVHTTPFIKHNATRASPHETGWGKSREIKQLFFFFDREGETSDFKGPLHLLFSYTAN